MLEHYTGSDEVTEAGRAVIDFIRSQGLSICRVSGRDLVLIPDGEYPVGNLTLLATRTPVADAQQKSGTINIRASGLTRHSIYQDTGNPLVDDNGRFSFDRGRHGLLEANSLFYGPYIDLPAGAYRLRFLGVEGKGRANLTLSESFGVVTILETEITDWYEPISFSLDKPVQNFEVVLRKTDDLQDLSFHAIAVEKA